MKVVIVGGVAAGMSAATRLRRRDEDAHIVVFERGEHVSFANCGLPYYVGGVITERDALLLQTPASLASRFRIAVRTRHEVVAIDRAAKTVRVRDLAAGTESNESYDALVLAPGAAPFVPDLPAADRALALRNIADVDRMHAAVAKQPRTAVVLGAGFIGLEMAENLVKRGVRVTVVELADQVLAPLDPEMAALVQQRLTDQGVRVCTGTQVSAYDGSSATLGDGSTVPADLLIAAIGVRAESTLAADAGLATNARGGIVVDEQQRTSDPAVYAVGDAAQKRDAIDGGPAMVPLAQTANRHGRLVADVITGRVGAAAPVLGTAIVELFGLVVAASGMRSPLPRRMSAWVSPFLNSLARARLHASRTLPLRLRAPRCRAAPASALGTPASAKAAATWASVPLSWLSRLGFRMRDNSGTASSAAMAA